MLISVHLPKTAGTSFEQALRSHFGEGLTLDYADKPLHHSRLHNRYTALRHALQRATATGDRPPVTCIHGHFLPLGYRWMGAAGAPIFVTWLRDPLQRLASHYHYWRREAAPPATDTLHRQVLDEDWSFERFALAPALRNLYQRFLWGFPLSHFAFVGISEHYADDLEAFGRQVLGTALPVAQARRNPDLGDMTYPTEEALRKRIEAWHAADYRLYREALALRELRLRQP